MSRSSDQIKSPECLGVSTFTHEKSSLGSHSDEIEISRNYIFESQRILVIIRSKPRTNSVDHVQGQFVVVILA